MIRRDKPAKGGPWRRGIPARTFVTGGPHAAAFRKVFRSCLDVRPVHIRDCHWLKKFCSNSGREMLDRELADILGIIRGIRDPESHPFGLIMLHHNFIRPHTGLGGKAPVAGITIEGPPWMTPIENAALRKAAMAA